MSGIVKKYLALCLCLLLLAGCAEPQQPPVSQENTVQSQTPEAQQTVPMLALERDAGFDPYETTSACNRLILELVLEPLFAVEETGEVIPVLAEEWSVSDDGLTTTVLLKEGITLHNGALLTAETVLGCLQQAQKSTWYAGRFYALASAEAPDAGTLVFTTTKAYDCFPRLLEFPVCVMEGDLPAGTGPYRFADSSTLAPFDGWREEGYPAGRQELPLSAVATQDDLRDGFEYGGISAVSYDPNGIGAVHYSGDYELWGVPTTVMQYVGFNLEKAPLHPKNSAAP